MVHCLPVWNGGRRRAVLKSLDHVIRKELDCRYTHFIARRRVSVSLRQAGRERPVIVDRSTPLVLFFACGSEWPGRAGRGVNCERCMSSGSKYLPPPIFFTCNLGHTVYPRNVESSTVWLLYRDGMGMLRSLFGPGWVRSLSTVLAFKWTWRLSETGLGSGVVR